METTKKIWLNGELIDWDNAKTHILTHTLHYGAGVFEGTRFYNTPKGIAVFRLTDHIKRLFYSASVLDMELKFSQENFISATLDLLKVNGINSGYLRHICYYGYERLGLNPTGIPIDHSIAAWPWGKYLGKDAVSVKTSKYIRPHPQSTITDAKIVGNYVNSILASLEVKKTGYDEALLLDYKGNVAEGPGENIFWIKNGDLFTVEKGNILPGITRDSIMTIAADKGIKVAEVSITLNEIKKADEVFFTGTAAEVTGVAKIDETVIGNGELGEITKKLKDIYMSVVHGNNKKYEKWLSYVI